MLIFLLLYSVASAGPITDLNCQLLEINGYLHEKCTPWGWSKMYNKCPRSNDLYLFNDRSGKRCEKIWFSLLCPFDPGFYQACGIAECSGYKELGGTPLLCGTYLCVKDRYVFAGLEFGNYYQCQTGLCTNTKLNMIGCEGDLKCNNKCDRRRCSDESFCNGVQYGLWCERGGVKMWIYPLGMCRQDDPYCDNREDTEGCFDFKKIDHTTCYGGDSYTLILIKIQQSMRCAQCPYSNVLL